jgi:hypothetical protein
MIHACPHHAGRPPEKQHELQCIRPTPSNYLRELPRLPRAPRLVVPSSRRRLSEASSTRTSSPAASSAADISRLLLAARDGQSQVRAACAKDSCCDLNNYRSNIGCVHAACLLPYNDDAGSLNIAISNNINQNKQHQTTWTMSNMNKMKNVI